MSETACVVLGNNMASLCEPSNHLPTQNETPAAHPVAFTDPREIGQFLTHGIFGSIFFFIGT